MSLPTSFIPPTPNPLGNRWFPLLRTPQDPPSCAAWPPSTHSGGEGKKESRPFYSQRKRTAKGASGGVCGEGGLVGEKVPPDDSPTFQLEKK